MSIQAAEHLNGNAPPAVIRVKFGPGETDEIPLDWAEDMLANWRNAEVSNAKTPKFTDALGDCVLRNRQQK
jgi:hypothetical protein